MVEPDDEEEIHPPRGGHPLQPVVLDEKGVARFKANKIVCALLDFSQARGFGLNEIGALCRRLSFSNEDQEQFAQLIGYSVSGAADLRYFSDEAYSEAAAKADALLGRSPPK